MNIITRKDAIIKGEKYYFTGQPCPLGHISKRSVHNCTCYDCKCLSRTKAEKKNNLVVNARMNKRRACKINRTPNWADLEAITTFYKNCPKGMVVDHIIPLQGETVSGFHVVSNLQYLTREENAQKYNKFETLHSTSSNFLE